MSGAWSVTLAKVGVEKKPTAVLRNGKWKIRNGLWKKILGFFFVSPTCYFAAVQC